MYNPREWPVFAQNLAQISIALGNAVSAPSTASVRRRALESIQLFDTTANNGNASDSPLDSAYIAITCADAVDPGKTTTRDGFDAVVNLTQHVSSMCKYGHALFLSYELTQLFL